MDRYVRACCGPEALVPLSLRPGLHLSPREAGVRVIAWGTAREDLEGLRHRVQLARWRVRSAAYGGPEWDAAVWALEELERELRRVRRRARGRCSA